MDIFQSIGVNATAIVQFVLFAIMLIFMSKVVFAPYAHALEERQKRTKGGEDLALEFQKKSVELQSTYENKSREINDQMKQIFDAARAEANKKYESSVGASRAQATQLTTENRSKISTAVAAASAELKTQTNMVAMAITNKLLGK